MCSCREMLRPMSAEALLRIVAWWVEQHKRHGGNVNVFDINEGA